MSRGINGLAGLQAAFGFGAGAGRAGIDAAVRTMRLYLGSVDYASVRDQQRLYTRTLTVVTKVADAHGIAVDDAWAQIEAQARRLGPIRPRAGQDI